MGLRSGIPSRRASTLLVRQGMWTFSSKSQESQPFMPLLVSEEQQRTAFTRYSFYVYVRTEVAEDGEEHFVEDLSSTNGTHIGPHQYPLGDWKLYQLVDGKQISFGPVQCTYEYIGVPAAGLGEMETQTQILESTVSFFSFGTRVALLYSK